MIKALLLKNEYLLAALTIALLLISYNLAFKRTLVAWQTYCQLKQQAVEPSSLSYQPGYAQRKDENLNKIISFYKADTITFRNTSVSTIALIAAKEDVKVSEVPIEDPAFNTDKLIIQKLDFEGDFFNLTKVLDKLQQTKGIGIIRSFTYKFKGSQNDQSNHKILELEILFVIFKG